MRPSWESIRSHPFFASINWKKLESRGYDREFKPISAWVSLLTIYLVAMFRACFGNKPLQSVDSGKNAIGGSYPELSTFKKVVLQHKEYQISLGGMHLDYKCPAEVNHDPVHGASCKTRVCKCDLPADWYKI